MNFFKKHKSNIIFIFLTFLTLILFVVSFLFSFDLEDEKEESEEEVKEEVKKEEKKMVLVDIKGQINKPGVYEMEEGKRVIDVIEKAEGLTNSADTSKINLSQKVTDEMVIIVYSKKEIEEMKKTETEVEIKNDASITEKKETVTKTSEKISINTATKEELMTLSGIGESKAESIISYREENGLFEKIEDITLVSGIGEALFEKIKNNITI